MAQAYLKSTPTLIAEVAGNGSGQMVIEGSNPARVWGGGGVSEGLRIELGTATTAKVEVKDSSGRVLHSAASAITADVDPDTAQRIVNGPLTWTVTEISDAEHTLTIRIGVRE
jgi:hypothetical protein